MPALPPRTSGLLRLARPHLLPMILLLLAAFLATATSASGIDHRQVQAASSEEEVAITVDYDRFHGYDVGGPAPICWRVVNGVMSRAAACPPELIMTFSDPPPNPLFSMRNYTAFFRVTINGAALGLTSLLSTATGLRHEIYHANVHSCVVRLFAWGASSALPSSLSLPVSLFLQLSHSPTLLPPSLPSFLLTGNSRVLQSVHWQHPRSFHAQPGKGIVVVFLSPFFNPPMKAHLCVCMCRIFVCVCLLALPPSLTPSLPPFSALSFHSARTLHRSPPILDGPLPSFPITCDWTPVSIPSSPTCGLRPAKVPTSSSGLWPRQ